MFKDNKKSVIYILLFFVVFSYFLWLNSAPVFPDPDSFYHAKAVELISKSGIIREFVWLPWTTLNEIYIDHHFFYHLILMPFTFFLNPLAALKLSAAFFAALVIVVFYWFLQKNKIKYAWAYTLVLLASHQFIFRINLAKTSSVSLIFLLLFLYYLFRIGKKWTWPLFIISFLYVWLYGGWMIMLGIGLIYLLTSMFLEWIKVKPLAISYKPALSIISGFVAGLVINPYFPMNLKFYWQQTFKIGLINFKDVIGVGGEWYGFNLVDLISYDVLVFMVLLAGVSFFIFYFKKQDEKSWTLFLTALVFFLLTLKSRRNVEYFVPFGLIFGAFVINAVEIAKCRNWIRNFIAHKKALTVILFVLILAQIPIIICFNYLGLRNSLQKGYRFDQFSGVSKWLAGNTQAGEIIFHDNWSDWPVLFYNNTDNRYIVGLDPSFMYFKDKDRYWLWHDISTGKAEENICQRIKDEFESNYVFVRNGNNKTMKNIEKDERCDKVYEDEDGVVYVISNSPCFAGSVL
ncbi:MAG: hypothetical protein ABIJ83_02725 [Patescibacteria group bacterium]